MKLKNSRYPPPDTIYQADSAMIEWDAIALSGNRDEGFILAVKDSLDGGWEWFSLNRWECVRIASIWRARRYTDHKLVEFLVSYFTEAEWTLAALANS